MDIRINRPPQLHSTWFTKFIECFFTGVACLNFLLLTINLLPQAILIRLGQPFFGILFLGQFLLGLGFGIGYSIYWQRREDRAGSGHRIDSARRHAWLTDSTAWTTAYIEERGARAFAPTPMFSMARGAPCGSTPTTAPSSSSS
jgi:hypothetical protein